ncbi:membrane-bound lytic murein transglycosylase C [Alteromonadaceae bacterium Bs31]|nr:membrane-bound lytic murein transglycosylase C [Alteromonadaceae bacterium Bs31]
MDGKIINYLKTPASVLSLVLAFASISYADLFDELEAETKPSQKTTPQKQKDFSQHADDAFSSLETETLHGTQSQSEEELEKEFQAWKQQYFEELDRYKKDILKIWDEAEVTDKKTWVEYSKDMKTKKVIDYENNEIRISVVEDNNSPKEVAVESMVEELITTTTEKAQKNDPVLAAIAAPTATQQNHEAAQQSLLSELNDENTSSKQQIAKTLARSAKVEKAVPAKMPNHAPVTTITIKLPNDAILKRAEKYASVVKKQAERNNLERSLIYAVMHTESAFNPMARSQIPAFGLMQIVPESAGRDVSKKIYGEDKILPASFLYNADNNIEVGSAYINILYYSYLRKITNPTSRLYCAIAAYNTGAGNVSVAFTGNRKLSKAVPIINSMTPQQVYDTLSKKLPYDETKKYLHRVVQRQQMYAQTQL